MKTVYLFRHGDTEDTNSGSDYSRKLTEEGRLQTATMADHLKIHGIRAHIIITSGAVRAVSTAAIIAGKLKYPETDILIEDILYFSQSAVDVLSLVRNISDKLSSILIVGHNPVLSDSVSFICRNVPAMVMGKSSVARIDFNTDDWTSITQGSGKIIFFKTFENGVIADVSTYVQE